MAAGLVVPEVDLHALAQMIVSETSAAGTLAINRPSLCWDVGARLPPPLEKEIRDTILTPLNRNAFRKNSKQAKTDRIRAAVERIAHEATLGGVPFDRKNLLGVKRDFLGLVARHSIRANRKTHMSVVPRACALSRIGSFHPGRTKWQVYPLGMRSR
jgi:hypothetical protein